jgi:glucose/arabinose dehydrogenase
LPATFASRLLAGVVAAGVLALPGSAAAHPGLVGVGQFSSPTYVTAPPGDYHRLFVVELAGRVRVIKDGVVLPTPFLDISSKVGTAYPGGLLSIAFPSDYSKSGRFYAYYTDLSLNVHIAEFLRSPNKPDSVKAGSERTVLMQPRSAGIVDHYGGQLQFGSDGRLYVSIGDGGPAGDPNSNAQNLGVLWGKLLRIDPQRKSTAPYRVPSDNPFVGVAGARPEIWAYGLRNPWRFSFDRSTGDLTIGDVGQERVDEVDYTPKASGGGGGANFGWNCLEGRLLYASCTAANPVNPVLEIFHTSSDPNCSYSITGGYVVHDAGLPTLNGRYLYGDYCHGEVRSAQLALPSATQDASTGINLANYSLVSFGEDGCGRLYAVSINGPVYRLQDGTASPCPPTP